MGDEKLYLRKMTFDGIEYDDDWLVTWRGLPVGRIMKQGGLNYGKPDWWWGVNWGHRPQLDNQRGVGLHLEDCKRQFHEAWMRVRGGLSDAEIRAAIRDRDEALD